GGEALAALSRRFCPPLSPRRLPPRQGPPPRRSVTRAQMACRFAAAPLLHRAGHQSTPRRALGKRARSHQFLWLLGTAHPQHEAGEIPPGPAICCALCHQLAAEVPKSRGYTSGLPCVALTLPI